MRLMKRMLEALSRERADVCTIQVASLDGFHLHQSELESRWAWMSSASARSACAASNLEAASS